MNSRNKCIVSKIVPLSRQDTWDLIWRADSQFLGRQAQIVLKVDEIMRLADDTHDWRMARIEKVNPPKSISIVIDPSSPAHLGQKTHAIIYFKHLNDSHCNITIEESNIPGQCFDEANNYWLRRLEHFNNVARNIQKRRKRVRQAVVVIHGIGEQRPGETLYNLMSGDALAKGAKLDKWVKPDNYSDSYELRKVTLKGTKARPTTDVYEFYWAHMIRDTTLDQVSSWLRSLLLKKSKSVPGPLRPGWCLVRIVLLIIAGVNVAAVAGIKIVSGFALGSWVLAFLLLLWRYVGKKMAIDYIGDAARYLRPYPSNIAHRQAIRESGISLMERLHNSGEYDRIVLVGHSLGSVIAYDIVTYLWIRMHDKHQRPSYPTFKQVIDVEKASVGGDKESQNAFQRMQHAAWRQQRVNCQPWLITDLVTVGSPLTYADFLIADNRRSFIQSKRNRILPACPPHTEPRPKEKRNGEAGNMRMTCELNYEDTLSRKSRTFVAFDHGAPFGVTRWTNLYFKTTHCGLWGDIIGGPIKPRFGNGVRDVPLDSPWKSFSHTFYWKEKGDKECDNKHIQALQTAINLNTRAELTKLLDKIPAFALLAKSAVY